MRTVAGTLEAGAMNLTRAGIPPVAAVATTDPVPNHVSFEHKAHQLVNQNSPDWLHELIRLCETTELTSTTVDPAVHGFLLAAYLAQGSLDNARFLWKRVPDSTKQASPAIAALWSVGSHMWKRSHGDVHEALNAFQWPGIFATLAAKIKTNYQEHVCALLEKAYTTIKWEAVAAYLGCSTKDQVVAVVSSRGWGCQDPDFAYPHRIEQNEEGQAKHLEQLGKLTNLMMHLET